MADKKEFEAVEMSEQSRADLARQAFISNDPAMSQLAHAMPVEHHQASGEYSKTIVFGGLDGIITTFSLVTSIQGASLSTGVVIVLGIANLIADAIGMAFGEYIGEKSEHEWIERERSRETWEFDNYKEGEMNEMVELYKKKGFTEEDAREILTIMGNHKEFFIDHMMVQELGIMPPDDGANAALIQSLIMFASFVLFGFVPLFAYVIFNPIHWSGFNPSFLVACILTALALFGLGAFKSKWESTAWWWSGTQVLFNGAIAALVAYLVALVLDKLIKVSC